jgi:hypothetical protein
MRSATAKRLMSTRKAACIIAACTLAMMNNVGASMATAVALPDIGKDLNIAAANLQWVVSAYTLTSVRCHRLSFGFGDAVMSPCHVLMTLCFV